MVSFLSDVVCKSFVRGKRRYGGHQGQLCVRGGVQWFCASAVSAELHRRQMLRDSCKSSSFSSLGRGFFSAGYRFLFLDLFTKMIDKIDNV